MIELSEEQKDFNTVFKKPGVGDICSSDWLGVICCIVNECQRNPNVSIRDITNEALGQHGIDLLAHNTSDDSHPIAIF